MDGEDFLKCLRTARKGATAFPSGKTADHLFSILESEVDSELLVQVASKLAGDVPDDAGGLVDRIGKTRRRREGIVVGDIVRRLVARTIAKQFAKKKKQRLSLPVPVRPVDKRRTI